jgi:hypothetical protein
MRTADQSFNLYKLIAMPTRINGDTFIKYDPEHLYFGLSVSQRDYVLLNAEDLQQCTTGSLWVCRISVPLFDAQAPSCESSLYFQNNKGTPLCKRSLLPSYEQPTLQSHGISWVYQFLTSQQITFRCPQGAGWTTRIRTLHGGGLIHNATTCAVATEQIRTLPELRQNDYIHLDTPAWHMPELTPMMSLHKTPQTEKNLPAAVQDLEDIKGCTATPLRSLDLDTLIQIRHSLRPQENEHYWYQIITITVCTFTIISILCYALRYQLCRWLCKNSSNDSNQVPQPSPQNTTLEHATPSQKEEQPSKDVTFTNYALRSTP